MKDTLERICELQRSYSSVNTPEMQERGRLIRHSLPAEFERFEGRLRSAMGRFADDFDIGSSDGIGRKTEAPWVRICSKAMSPAPTNGFYAVVHFARNGSAVFITVGCGSTVWTPSGDLKAVSDSELKSRTDWARQVVQDEYGTLAPFIDEISLGATASLPRTFEKATAIAKRIPVEQLSDEGFEELLVQATERLACIYRAQAIGRDITPSDADEAAVQAIARPQRASSRGQGIRISAEERIAIEWRAMDLAREWLGAQGYSVDDKSKTASFDFEAIKDGEAIKVEVKGTTSDRADAISMTRNEVDLHRAEMGKTGLIVVSQIRLERIESKMVASGGRLQAEIGWNIDEWAIEATMYRVARKS